MLITISVDDASLHMLADLIAARLNSQSAPPQIATPFNQPAPVSWPQENPYGSQPPSTFSPPDQAVQWTPPPTQTYQPPAPLGGPPQLNGNVKVFPPAKDHPTQQNSTVDVMSKQGMPGPQAMSTPPIPQFSNAPVNVGPVAMSAPVSPGPAAAIDANGVKKLCIPMYQTERGKVLIAQCLQQSGIGAMTNVTDANAGQLFAWLQHSGALS